MNPDKHYIVCAAVYYQYPDVYPFQPFNIENGFIICGLRHPNCLNTFHSVLGATKKRDGTTNHSLGTKQIQGFLTSHNLFVDRKEAYIIAEACGQLENRKVHIVGTLFSEDLY
jgi:hypothetical protein